MENIIKLIQENKKISEDDFNIKWGHLSTEEFLTLSPEKKLNLNMDITLSGLDYLTVVKRWNKRPYFIYKLYDKEQDKFIDKEFYKRSCIAEFLDVSMDVIQYIVKYNNRDVKKPKYPIQNKYKIFMCRYDVIGNDHVKFDEGFMPLPKRKHLKENQCGRVL